MSSIVDDSANQGPLERTSGPAGNPAQLLLRAVGRFQLMILILTIIGTLGGLIVGFSQPNKYTSVGLLLMRMGAREAQTPESAIDPERQEVRVRGTATEDELQMLLDPALHKRVVAEVGAELILRPYDPSAGDTPSTPQYIRWMHELQSWLLGLHQPASVPLADIPTQQRIDAAVLRLAAGRQIRVQPRTNTLVISYTSNDKEQVQIVASAYIKVLQDRHREFYETESKYSFVNTQLEQANVAADAARAALIAQQYKDGISDLRGWQEALGLEIQNLEAQNRQEEILRLSQERQLVVLGEQISRTPERLGEALLPTAISEESTKPASGGAPEQGEPAQEPPIPDTLNTLVAELQSTNAKLVALGGEYAATSSYYQRESQRLQGRITILEGQIRRVRAAASAVGLDPAVPQQAAQRNPEYAALISQRLATERQLESIVASRVARAGVLSANLDRLKQSLSLEPIYTSLEHAVAETTQRAASLQKAHAEKATLQLIDSDERMSSLQIVQQPFIPMQKDGPDRLMIGSMGIFGGLALGLALAIMREMLDSRLRYAVDTENSLGLRVLGVVAEQSSWRQTGKKLQLTMKKPT